MARELPVIPYTIEGVDLVLGATRFGGRVPKYLKMLKMYAGTIISTLPKFEDYLDPEKKENAKTELHTLKGVCGNLAMNELYERIVEFEVTIKNGEPDENLCSKVSETAQKVCSDIIRTLADA